MSAPIRADIGGRLWQVGGRRTDALREDGAVVSRSAWKRAPAPGWVPGVVTQLTVAEGDEIRRGDAPTVIG